MIVGAQALKQRTLSIHTPLYILRVWFLQRACVFRLKFIIHHPNMIILNGLLCAIIFEGFFSHTEMHVNAYKW